MANSSRDPNREKVWRQVVARHAKSGLTVRQFCHREGLQESAFYFWRRTIQERGPKRCTRKQPAFVPLVLGATNLRSVPDAAAGVTLELRGGRALRLSESFPVERLATLVHALEANEGQP